MAQALELIAELHVVVELAVVGDRELAGSVDERLVAALAQVDDREAPVGEADLEWSVPGAELLAGEPGERAIASRGQVALAVRPAMLERVPHAHQHRRIDSGADRPRYPAHDQADSTRSISPAKAFAGAG